MLFFVYVYTGYICCYNYVCFIITRCYTNNVIFVYLDIHATYIVDFRLSSPHYTIAIVISMTNTESVLYIWTYLTLTLLLINLTHIIFFVWDLPVVKIEPLTSGDTCMFCIHTISYLNISRSIKSCTIVSLSYVI